MPVSRLDDQVGRVLGGRYRLLAPIGSGGSAQVFLAEDAALGRRVAVKVLHAALADDSSFQRRFEAEARAVAALQHPNIMAVHDWGEDSGTAYLVLEYLAGGSLRDLLDHGGRLSLQQAVAVGADAAKGIAYAHARGLVHRDIKPANLLFDEQGRLAVGDFGLARALAEAAWTEPAGLLLGTARYASPEQVEGKAIEGRADVYSLSLVLVEAVAGEVPFAADTTIATLMGRVGRTIGYYPALGPLQPVVSRAAAPLAEARPTAAELAAELAELARELPAPDPLPLAPVSERPSGTWGPLGADPTEVAGLAGSGASAFAAGPAGAAGAGLAAGAATGAGLAALAAGAGSPSPPRRRRLWLAWAAVLAVVVLVATGITFLKAPTLFSAPRVKVPALGGQPFAAAAARLRRLGLKPEVKGRVFDGGVPAGDVTSQEPAGSTTAPPGSVVAFFVSAGPAPRVVPSLSGLGEAPAIQLLVRHGFVATVTSSYSEAVTAGSVISWSPSVGLVPKGATITVVVSAGPRPRVVPQLAGDTYQAAVAKLQALGLAAAEQQAYSSTAPAGTVISTAPGPAATVARGTTITVTVSKGPDLVAVPDVAGQGVLAATSAMASAGLSVSNVYGPPNQPVFATQPPPGAKVPRGSSVNLYTG
ncbi:MAG: Stk1 family PASTA domain-containing Ser/Thr kinase [Acidimicrobiales bacterium]